MMWLAGTFYGFTTTDRRHSLKTVVIKSWLMGKKGERKSERGSERKQ